MVGNLKNKYYVEDTVDIFVIFFFNFISSGDLPICQKTGILGLEPHNPGGRTKLDVLALIRVS